MAIKSSNQITFTEQKKIIEIKEWYLATNQNTGITRDTEGWTTDVQIIDYTKSYLWNWEEVVYSIGDSDKSEPVIISSYGKGISNIINYYQVTPNLIVPGLPGTDDESSWSDVSIATTLSPTNKYLWSYESIIYTDGTVTNTDPTIIGVYGDSGEDAITFEIYSTQGFMFKEDMDEIELKIAAFQGATKITHATYTWEWWDQTLNDGKGEYVLITPDGNGGESSNESEIIGDSLIVSKSAQYAFAHLKCSMIYNGNVYEDYVDLTNEVVVYSSAVRFFDGSNIFNSSSPYLIAYVSLYRNNNLVESIATDKYYIGNNNVSDNTITSDISGDFTDGDLVYFICEKEITYQEANGNGTTSNVIKNVPYAVLGQYQSATWNVLDGTNEYIYRNDIYPIIVSNVVVISQEDVSKSREVNFEIYKKEADKIGNFIETCVSRINVIVIDINDPIISSVEPENPNDGQLWLDTSSVPYKLYIYNQESGKWEYFSQQSGGAIYTSQPSSYQTGDLWILADGESCGRFGPGSMLKATMPSDSFNSSHWIDAMEENTQILNNVKQYFEFNADTGLKIGQKDEKFYVNISSTEMGFYDNSRGQNQKVVSIGNSAATIKNAIMQDGATFNCNAQFNRQVQFGAFVWKIESNGSLSIALSS